MQPRLCVECLVSSAKLGWLLTSKHRILTRAQDFLPANEAFCNGIITCGGESSGLNQKEEELLCPRRSLIPAARSQLQRQGHPCSPSGSEPLSATSCLQTWCQGFPLMQPSHFLLLEMCWLPLVIQPSLGRGESVPAAFTGNIRDARSSFPVYMCSPTNLHPGCIHRAVWGRELSFLGVPNP